MCKNCYNGCVEITSDQCIRYTGINIPLLGISNGDTLASVESSIITYLLSTLNGTGISPQISSSIICNTIKQYLPCINCTSFNLNDILQAIIKAICSLQEQIDDLNSSVNTIEASYTLNCLTGDVSPTAGTHAVLQSLINFTCLLSTSLEELAINLSTNYVSIANINSYIENYINENTNTNLINSKMVPFCPIPYIGSLSNFDLTGAGIGNWTKVYLCNGQNGTPDYRGRILVGTTSMGTTPFNPIVDPAISGNPTYNINSVAGANQVTLNVNQMPSHTHVANATGSASDHFHYTVKDGANATLSALNAIDKGATYGGNTSYTLAGTEGDADLGKTSTSSITITVGVTNDPIGGGQAHSNIPPVQATHYIIYIP